MITDLMVDIETLGTVPESVIVQIGACYFDRSTGEIYEKFNVNIQIQDSLNHGLKVDGGALKFWFEQGTSKMTWLERPEEFKRALGLFRNFCQLHSGVPVWSHASFDMPILNEAYRIIGEKLPVSYRLLRDIRTLVDLSGMKKPAGAKEGKTHTGIDDCVYQVAYCSQCFRTLSGINK